MYENGVLVAVGWNLLTRDTETENASVIPQRVGDGMRQGWMSRPHSARFQGERPFAILNALVCRALPQWRWSAIRQKRSIDATRSSTRVRCERPPRRSTAPTSEIMTDTNPAQRPRIRTKPLFIPSGASMSFGKLVPGWGRARRPSRKAAIAECLSIALGAMPSVARRVPGERIELSRPFRVPGF